MRFFPGLHQPSDAHRFKRACISINRLGTRRKPLGCPEVLIDSGAFTEISTYGRYRSEPAAYASALRRLVEEDVAEISAAVAQDFMCEPFILAKTGLTIAEHQRLTIERYDRLLEARPPCRIVPVLQGYEPHDYCAHGEAYGARLEDSQWVGVGSLCKRNGRPERILEVLAALRAWRPDLELHGFGLKQTALLHAGVCALLSTADSMAWSFSARKQGRSPNDWHEAERFAQKIASTIAASPPTWQLPLPLWFLQ
jgi:hypothetical protein